MPHYNNMKPITVGKKSTLLSTNLNNEKYWQKNFYKNKIWEKFICEG